MTTLSGRTFPWCLAMWVLAAAAGCDVEETGAGGGEATDDDDVGAGAGDPADACSTHADCEGRECWAASCVEGACSLEPQPGTPCRDGMGVCSEDATCIVGGCSSDTECEAPSECARGACVSGICELEPRAAGTPCVDGACDGGGICTAAECVDASDCPDEACLQPACVEGACIAAPTPGEACSGDVGLPGLCSAAGTCATCEQACQEGDGFEGNATQDTAAGIGTISDCGAFALCGALEPGETDWFTYFGTDDGCNVAPIVEFAGPDLTVCQYFACSTTPTSFGCPAGTTADVAPGGQSGCCGTSGWDVDPCAGGLFDDEDGQVWIKVERAGGSSCGAYALWGEY